MIEPGLCCPWHGSVLMRSSGRDNRMSGIVQSLYNGCTKLINIVYENNDFQKL